MAKKITNRSILGQQGINLVEEQVLAMGFAWHPTNQAVEAGIDGHIELRNLDTEQALNLVVAVQSKARTDFAGETDDGFTFYCDERDIQYWLQGNIPIILVVSRPSTREAYWVNVKAYFDDPAAREAKKVVFDKRTDRFDATVRDRLFSMARPVDSGLYLAPFPKTEQLISNLLPVVFPVSHVSFGTTQCRDHKGVVKVFNANGLYPGLSWILHGGKVVSFDKLDEHPWSLVCGPGSVTLKSTAELAASEDADEQYLFLRLVVRCLEAKCLELEIMYDERGGQAQVSKVDRTPHLSEQDSYQLLLGAIKTYRKEHSTYPARVVVHKSSSYDGPERTGFRGAVKELGIEYCDLVTVRESFTRLFRDNYYPPLRGTMLTLDERTHVLYTRGGVEFFETYPGLYVPLPLEIACEDTEASPEALAREILELTKMNWNNTQFDGKWPITLLAARKVGSILRHLGPTDVVEPYYGFYM